MCSAYSIWEPGWPSGWYRANLSCPTMTRIATYVSVNSPEVLPFSIQKCASSSSFILRAREAMDRHGFRTLNIIIWWKHSKTAWWTHLQDKLTIELKTGVHQGVAPWVASGSPGQRDACLEIHLGKGPPNWSSYPLSRDSTGSGSPSPPSDLGLGHLYPAPVLGSGSEVQSIHFDCDWLANWLNYCIGIW